MGSIALFAKVDGRMPQEKFDVWLRARQLLDFIEHGSQDGCAGDFQSFLRVVVEKNVFTDQKEAEEFILKNCLKWDRAVAVTVNPLNEYTGLASGKDYWLVGGWAVC